MKYTRKMEDCPVDRKPTGPITTEERSSFPESNKTGSGNVRPDNNSRITGERQRLSSERTYHGRDARSNHYQFNAR